MHNYRLSGFDHASRPDSGAVTIYQRIGDQFRVLSSALIRVGDSAAQLGATLQRARKIAGPAFNRFYFNTAHRPFNRKKYLKRLRRIRSQHSHPC